MPSYTISVKTGDQKGAGIDANVYIILHGKGLQTTKVNLDTFFKSNFDRGSIDNYTVDFDVDIPEVKRIELWHDTEGVFCNWYLDWIEVTNVESGHHLFIYDTCLPQDDPFQKMRLAELENMKEEYELQVKVPGLPAQVKELPENETFSFDYQFNIGHKTTIYSEETKRLVIANGFHWKDEDDIKDMYTEVFGVPEGSKYFNDDAEFGRQRIASLNSLLISLCTAIPDKFGVTEEMVQPFLEGKTIEQAMAAKRLFIIDLAILEGCPAKSDEVVITCPFALFYFNNANHLMPIAIQLFQQKGPDNPVFLPSDPVYVWMLAKMWYNLADSTYHQALTHLNFTHFMMEGICVATMRNLSQSHPVHRLLSPHFIYLISINFLGLGVLVNEGGFLDKTSNGGIEGAFHLMRKRNKFGWEIIKELKNKYLLHDKHGLKCNGDFSEEGSMKGDCEIQNWGAEIVKSRDDGGCGMLGVPNNGQFETIDQLVVTLTAIIYTCSVGHAAASFQQYDEYGAPFSYPFIMHGAPPKDKEPVDFETVLKIIPNRAELLTLMSITKVLSEKRTKDLGNFEKQLIVDPPAIQVVEEFREDLENVGKTIDERNQKREHPYEWLHPSEIPNAISI
ncbi:ALOX5 [Mytilus edulis]|uniref:ALOX5 n=1 Tax=Mytilus edulis TaxID=6550 RepID=A0A8S3V7P8_MYTED|nr:ALOX5 [Mytilus edulis]